MVVDCGDGTCEDLENDYHCSCPEGKTGRHCEAGNMHTLGKKATINQLTTMLSMVLR